MESSGKKREPGRDASADGPTTHDPETTADQERGERLDTAKSIARGGAEAGPVPGAESSPKR